MYDIVAMLKTAGGPRVSFTAAPVMIHSLVSQWTHGPGQNGKVSIETPENMTHGCPCSPPRYEPSGPSGPQQ